MKKIIVLFIFSILSTINYAQIKRDMVHFNNGDEVECYIVKVKKKHLFYHMLGSSSIIEKVSLDDIEKYEFNNEFFRTNSSGMLEYSKVIKFDGASKEQLYETLDRWFELSSRNYTFEDVTKDTVNNILLGATKLENYLKLDVHSFANMASTIMVEETEGRSNTLSFDLIFRAKDDRYKVIFNNFIISNNKNDNTKNLKEVFEKRHNADLAKTLAFYELKRLNKFVTEQINSIEEYCINNVGKDTHEESQIKGVLREDDW